MTKTYIATWCEHADRHAIFIFNYACVQILNFFVELCDGLLWRRTSIGYGAKYKAINF